MFALHSKIKALLLGTLIGILLLAGTYPTFAQQGTTTPNPPMPEAQLDAHRILLPIVLRPSDYDLTVAFIELTQATQTSSNSVPLVAGRSTVARVYTQSNGSSYASGVTVTLSGTRGGTPLPGSPLPIGPDRVPVTWSRGDLATSFDVTLPSSWLSGNVTLEANVDSTNVIVERNESNNRLSITRAFNSVPTLDLKIVPIQYYNLRDGFTYDAPSSTYLAPKLLDMYPVGAVNVTRRASYYFSGDLANDPDWYSLLNEIDYLRTLEGAPSSRVYYGLIPSQRAGGASWFCGGIIGLGYAGMPRASIGLTNLSTTCNYIRFNIDGGLTAAHEIGHNLGREHAPCGVTGDPHYPYSGGIIGQFGFSMAAFQVIPVNTADIMSYCEPAWVSDYTYIGLYNNQRTFGALEPASSPTEGLWVRARISDQDSVTLKPFYAIQGWPEPGVEQGDYIAEFLDQAGQVIASHPVKVHRAEEPGLLLRTINTILPLPDAPFTSLRLVKGNQVAAEQSISNLDAAGLAEQAMPTPEIQQTGDSLSLSWGMPDVPASVRYSDDGGQTWTGLAIDILGGALSIDPASLPKGSLEFQIFLSNYFAQPLSLIWENAN